MRRIQTLAAFLFTYHPHQTAIKAKLVENGQRFLALIGSHYYYCKGDAFHMTKNGPYKVTVDGRIMVGAAFFRKMNPNYTRPKIDATSSLSSDPLHKVDDLFRHESITVDIAS